MRRKLKEPMVISLSEAARIAEQTERERPCTSCIRYNPNALIGRCNFARADFRHTCFIERYEPKRKRHYNKLCMGGES